MRRHATDSLTSITTLNEQKPTKYARVTPKRHRSDVASHLRFTTHYSLIILIYSDWLVLAERVAMVLGAEGWPSAVVR